MAKKKPTQPSFDVAMAELRTIVDELQQAEIGLDEMTARAKRAAELIQLCRQRLRQVDNEMEDLFDSADD